MCVYILYLSMKKILLLILFLVAANHVAQAQNCGDDFLGSKTLYKKPAKPDTAAPTGYVPVFINHVGRHGARFPTTAVKSSYAYQLIHKADSLGLLTSDGDTLWKMIKKLNIVVGKNAASISIEGRQELKGIGERMAQNYKSVFARAPLIEVRVTKELRTKQSDTAFFKGLNGVLRTNFSPAAQNDSVDLRFYDISCNYKKFEDSVPKREPEKSFDKQLGLEKIDYTVTHKIFKSAILDTLNDTLKKKFVSDLFGFACIVYSLQNEIKNSGLPIQDFDFKSFFTCDQLKKLDTLGSADEYLKKGPGVNNNGIQVRVAVPLLVDFINTADAYIKSGKFGAKLRFAHAETIAPIAALFEIEGADKASSNIYTISKVWKSSKVIPLSSNIQWIFYRNTTAPYDFVVKILLNEQQASISGLEPLKINNKNWYRWRDLRAFYVKKLAGWCIPLDYDMTKYLKKLTNKTPHCNSIP